MTFGTTLVNANRSGKDLFRDILTLILYPTSAEKLLFGNIFVNTVRDYLVA
jgi:hypothetical protein